MSTASSCTSNSCFYCGKSYTRKSSFDKHSIICEMAHKSKRLKICEEEESTDIPSVEKLYKIIQEMAFKQQKMEEKMEEMQKWIDKKKKKLNVVNWLNVQFTPTELFEARVRSIVVIQEDVTTLIEQNFAQSVVNILKRNLKTPKEGAIREPIACFSEKASVFYIYKATKNESDQESTLHWAKMAPEEFVYLLRIIHSKLLNGVCTWRDFNAERIRYNDKFADLYNKTVIKLMSADFNQESTLSKIRSPLYTLLKGDLKNMIEYDFEF